MTVQAAPPSTVAAPTPGGKTTPTSGRTTGGAGTTPRPPVTPEAPDPPRTPVPATPETPGPAGGNAGSRALAWVPFGPASPNSPEPVPRVYARVGADCDRGRAEPENEGMQGNQAAFWQAAASLCHAVRAGDVEGWSVGLALWQESGSRHAPADCFEAATRQAVDQLVAAVGPALDAASVTLSGRAPGYACAPTGLALQPSSGPPGTEVTVSWQGPDWFDEVSVLRLGEQEVLWNIGVPPDPSTFTVPEGSTGTAPGRHGVR